MSAPSRRFIRGVKVSERNGAGEWMAERISSLVLVPLSVWGLWSAWTLAGADYATTLAWIGAPVNAVLLAVTLVATAWHLNLGLKVVVDDYIHRPGSRNALLAAIAAVCLLLAALSVFFIVRLALSSAPLPAGFGI